MSEDLSIDIISGGEEDTEEQEEETYVETFTLSEDDDVSKVLDHPTEETSLDQSLNDDANNDSFNRLVVVSWKIRQYSLLAKALKDNVAIVRYNNDANLAAILDNVSEILKGNKIISCAMMCSGNPGSLALCHDKILNAKSFHDDGEMKKFFNDLVDIAIDRANPNSHFDLLATSVHTTKDGQTLVQELQDYIRLPITTSKDIFGEQGSNASPGEIYFSPTKLRSWSGSSNQSISNYEKIRTLGRGAYGVAVLYRKKDDDTLVALKEISILDLNATERSSAMNEVKVLSMLSHPNIISYYDSFDEDGTLWIEMEYADGGTLADYLSRQDGDMDERDILIIFSQMVSAIKYCHAHNILHRDLKTQNIFLTQEGKVKLGDFGIAKIMNTHNGGNFTVVGTPYYISPEMCEGLAYDNKSDIWALGCILYEMANLVKTFDGTNLPALINKIVKGSFAPIKDTYSPELRMLAYDLLQKNPNVRPTAEDILYSRLPELLKKYTDVNESTEDIQNAEPVKTRSLLYYCDISTMQLHLVKGLPVKMRITEMAAGLAHVVVISNERGVYAWGDNTYGQLGLGDYESRDQPVEIEALRGKSIVHVVCGDNYTAFLTDNGLVLTCGQGDYGALGHADWANVTAPKLVDDLLTVDISMLVGGAHHMAMVSTDGGVYTWGCGAEGQLGHAHRDNVNVPTRVRFVNEAVFVRYVQCCENATVFIADTGNLFACGSNQGNKLGLNPRQGFLAQIRSKPNKNVIESMDVPTLVKDWCKYQIVSVHFGASHVTMIGLDGRVYTNGDNHAGQLGGGNTKPRELLAPVRGFEDKYFSLIACGSTFSLAGLQTPVNGHTLNTIYFWGAKPHTRRRKRSAVNSPIESYRSPATRLRTKTASFDDEEHESSREGSDSSRNSARNFLEAPKLSSSAGDTSARASSASSESLAGMATEDSRQKYLKQLMVGSHTQTLNLSQNEQHAYTLPYAVFTIESIGGIQGFEEEDFAVVLQSIVIAQNHVFILFETNAPPPKTLLQNQKSTDSSSLLSSSIGSSSTVEEREEEKRPTSAFKTEVPTWLKDELKDGIPLTTSTMKPSGAQSPTTTKPQSPEHHRAVRACSFVSLNQSHFASKDPNFNLIPKLQRQGTLSSIKESTLERENQGKKSPETCSANSSANVEYTPIEILVEEKPPEPEAVKKEEGSKTKSKVPPYSRARVNRNRGLLSRRSTKKQQDRTEEVANKKSEDAEKIKENANDSEGKLLAEIERIKLETEQREKELKELHEKKIREKEELSITQASEAQKREKELKDEIFNLKSDLNNQNSKLQDNYNILLSLQEQLLHIQQNQMRSPPNVPVVGEQPPAYTKEASSKSSVCRLM